MPPLPGNMQGANFPTVKFFLLTGSRPSAIIPKVKGGSIMKQEAFTMSLLFDTYGALLTEKQQTYFDLYYNQDLSLAEIAEQEGISRQGVHDAISRSEALLASFERVTGCVAREQKLRHALAAITAEAQPLLQAGDPATRQGAQRILAAVDSLKE